MKIAILGDMHIGARNASLIVGNYQLKFFEDIFFPYLEKHKIEHIIQLGDVFDTRKFSNHIILNEWKRRFFDKLPATMHIILGNHDIASKNTLEVNSPELLLQEYIKSGVVKVYNQPQEVTFCEVPFLFVPWICLDNHLECETFLSESTVPFVFGHFEIDGFEMHRGTVCNSGYSKDYFSKFKKVISGHFHTKSEKENIFYVGTPYELTWIDFNDPKGFHIFDSKKQIFTFHKNPLTLFNKVIYDDKNKDSSNFIQSLELDKVKDTFVKLIVVSKTNPYLFEKVVEKLYNIGIADLKIVEDISEFEADSVDDEDLEFEDTKSLIESYINSVETELDKERLINMMTTLYIEALEVIE